MARLKCKQIYAHRFCPYLGDYLRGPTTAAHAEKRIHIPSVQHSTVLVRGYSSYKFFLSKLQSEFQLKYLFTEAWSCGPTKWTTTTKGANQSSSNRTSRCWTLTQEFQLLQIVCTARPVQRWTSLTIHTDYLRPVPIDP